MYKFDGNNIKNDLFISIETPSFIACDVCEQENKVL